MNKAVLNQNSNNEKKILIIWRGGFENRRTIIDHLYSFKRYDRINKYFYLQMDAHFLDKDYSWIREGMFDAIIFHYTFLTYRTSNYWDNLVRKCQELFANTKAIKIVLPQDDYTVTARIWEFVRLVNIDRIYTVMRQEDYDIVYPKEEIGDVIVETVLTGYVDENLKKELSKKDICKNLDIMYRARKLPYVCGQRGQYKYLLAELFKKNAKGLKIDIANTTDTHNTLLGDQWIDTLARARCTIGCLGGSSVIDPYGLIAKKYEEYYTIKPNASYEEAKEECFPDLDEPLHGVLSPRIFEAALTRTTQILMGYDYQGVLIPEVDYIVLEEDFSNLSDVLLKVHDEEYCRQISNNCYRDIIETGKYSYKALVDLVIYNIPSLHDYSSKYKDGFILKKCVQMDKKVRIYYKRLALKSLLVNKYPNIPWVKIKRIMSRKNKK